MTPTCTVAAFEMILHILAEDTALAFVVKSFGPCIVTAFEAHNVGVAGFIQCHQSIHAVAAAI